MIKTENTRINCQQAAQTLGVNIKTIRQWAQAGKLHGVKVGSRGDWRFTHDELNKMLGISKDKYEIIKKFLLENADDIQKSANQKHIRFLGTDDATLENLKKNRQDYVKIVQEFANNLENVTKGKKTFEKIGAKIAKESVEQGLTLEETVDGTSFLKQAFWERLAETGLLYKLSTHDLYAFNHRISVYTDIVTLKIVFTYHNYQKHQTDRVSVAEASLKVSDERFRMLADNIQNLAWIAKPDGYIYWYNKRWYEYTGTKPKDMEGWGWQTVHDPKILPEVMKGWQASIKTGKPFDMTFPLRGADGKYRMFLTRVMPVTDEAGKLIQWTGTNTDISEQKKAEEKLLESQNRLAAVFESVADGITVFDLQGNIILLNEAQARISGYDNANEMKRNIEYFAEVFQLSNSDGKLCLVKDWPISRVYRGEAFTNFELHAKRTDIDREWDYNFSGAPVFDEKGKLILAVVVTRDVTALKQAEVEQQELARVSRERNELLKINKAKDEFIGIASHQLRTPATAVKQYIGIVLSGLGGELSENQRDYLQTAYVSNERQLKLINDLLKTAQIDTETFTLTRRRHSLSGLLREAADELQTMLDMKKQRLLMTGLDQDILVRVDETEIKLVFSNIIENASKYSHDKTDIQVVVRRTAKRVLITITDNGVGIRKGDQAKIFDKFTRSDNEL